MTERRWIDPRAELSPDERAAASLLAGGTPRKFDEARADRLARAAYAQLERERAPRVAGFAVRWRWVLASVALLTAGAGGAAAWLALDRPALPPSRVRPPRTAPLAPVVEAKPRVDAPPVAIVPAEPVTRARPRRVRIAEAKPAPVVAAAPAAPTSIVREAEVLRGALAALAQGAPAAALALSDQYAREFPAGQLSREIAVTRIDALLQLGRSTDARSLLDRTELDGLPRARELLVARGELRAAAGSCRPAISDFERALASGPRGAPTMDVRERALHGRAACLARVGAAVDAREAFRAYLREFPRGKHAAEAMEAARP